MAKDEAKGEKTIKIFKDLCIGCGTCVDVAPEYFKLGDDGKSAAIKQYDEKDKDKILEAKKSCPASAISLK